MRKREEQDNNKEVITVDINGLAARYGIGTSTARKIGRESGAVVKLGRRTLYLVERTDAYV